MNRQIASSVVLAALMATSAVLAYELTPRVKIADSQEKFSLDTLVPERFGEWQVDKSIVPLQVDPATQAKLDAIYNQTISRTYINRDGERIMLSIAYGGNQDDTMGVHKPEVCYGAQGFEIREAAGDTLKTANGALPVKRLMAVAGPRHEPITYWITIGNKAVMPGMEQRMLQLKYGLTGTVPDGMLVRVSNIDRQAARGYVLHDRFINDMLAAMDPKGRVRLAGAVTGA